MERGSHRLFAVGLLALVTVALRMRFACFLALIPVVLIAERVPEFMGSVKTTTEEGILVQRRPFTHSIFWMLASSFAFWAAIWLLEPYLTFSLADWLAGYAEATRVPAVVSALEPFIAVVRRVEEAIAQASPWLVRIFLLGFASHLVLDLLTADGIAPLYPYPGRLSLGLDVDDLRVKVAVASIFLLGIALRVVYSPFLFELVNRFVAAVVR